MGGGEAWVYHDSKWLRLISIIHGRSVNDEYPIRVCRPHHHYTSVYDIPRDVADEIMDGQTRKGGKESGRLGSMAGIVAIRKYTNISGYRCVSGTTDFLYACKL